MSEFTVAEWWTTTYNHPRAYSQLDVSNAIVSTSICREISISPE
jgi:hypothetical protein